MSLTVSASGITFDDLTTLSTGRISAVNLAPSSIGTLQLSAQAVTSSKIASGVSIVGSLSGTASIATTLATASAGPAPVYGCRAWANFNGLTTGTNTPSAAGNISSVQRVSTGVYRVNFTIPMHTNAYSTLIFARDNGSSALMSGQNLNHSKTTSSFTFQTLNTSWVVTDAPEINVAVFC